MISSAISHFVICLYSLETLLLPYFLYSDVIKFVRDVQIVNSLQEVDLGIVVYSFTAESLLHHATSQIVWYLECRIITSNIASWDGYLASTPELTIKEIEIT